MRSRGWRCEARRRLIVPKERPSFRYRPAIRLRAGWLTITVAGWGRDAGLLGASLRMPCRIRMPRRVVLEHALARRMTDEEMRRIQSLIVSLHRLRAYQSQFDIPEGIVKATLSALARLQGRAAALAHHDSDDESRGRIRAILREQGATRSQVDEDAFAGMPGAMEAAFRQWAADGCPENPAAMPDLVAETIGNMISTAAAEALRRPGRPRGRKKDTHTPMLAAECWWLWQDLTSEPARLWRKEGYAGAFVLFAEEIIEAWLGRPMDERDLRKLLRAERGNRYRAEIRARVVSP